MLISGRNDKNLSMGELEKLDKGLIERVIALDTADVEVDSWEAGFIESVVRREHSGWVLSPKQREAAMKILDKYEVQTRGEQQSVTKLPPGAEKYFKKQ